MQRNHDNGRSQATATGHSNRPAYVRACKTAAVASIIAFLTFACFHALNVAIDIPTFHLDGAFQAASGMFRLNAGQLPGRDFFPYLGVGPLLLVYPLFHMAGATFGASVLSAHFATLIVGWCAIAVLWHLVFRPRTAIYSLLGSAVVFAAPFIFPHSWFANVFAFTAEPGNSLKPIRAVAPYLMVAGSAIVFRYWARGSRRDALLGLLVGFIMLWSNDFAIPTAGIFSLFYCAIFYVEDRTTWKRSVLVFGLTACVSWAVLLSVATAGHPIQLLHYNFIDVAGDQWWYFGPYGPGTRVFDVSQLPRLISSENHFPLIVLALATLGAIATRTRQYVMLALIGLTLFAGGALASIGGHLGGGYFGAFYYWGTATAILWALRAGELSLARWLKIDLRTGGLQLGTILCAFLLLLVGAGIKFDRYREHIDMARKDANRFYVNEFGGYLDARWKDYIDYARRNKTRNVVEDYWGVWSSLNRTFPSWPVDAAIHALGDVRETARTSLAKADLIISTRYTLSPEWQPWNLSQNFWFYEQLLAAWEPDFVSPTSIVWRRAAMARQQTNVGCRVSADKNSFMLDSNAEGFYKVVLQYKTSGTGRHLLLVKNNISFAGDAAGYVSLPLGSRSVTIPVLIDQSSGNRFDSKVIGSRQVKFEIETCAAQTIRYVNNDVLHIKQPDEFYLTDGNWVRGISRGHAGFFVPNQNPFQTQYKIGRFVQLKNGDFRKIIGIAFSGPYINVDVDGPVLDPEHVGLPREFVVVDVPGKQVRNKTDEFYLTDQNWQSGVARSWAGFFVPNSYYFTSRFIPGKHVMFRNGETRKIENVVASGNYLNVHVEGAVLDPAKAGIPSEYSIVEK